MSFVSGFKVRGSLQRAASAMLHAWVVVLCTTLALSVLRAGQIVYHWPAGFTAPWSDIFSVLFQGGRFDLKASATAGLLLFPLFAIAPKRAGWVAGAFTVMLIFVSLVNLHYFGFYKTPIDPIVFGFFEDDTKAIVQTVWSDFPVVLTLLTLVVLSLVAIAGGGLSFRKLDRVLVTPSRPSWVMATGIL